MFFIMSLCYPRLPPLLYSIYEGPDTWIIRLLFCLYEAHILRVGFGIILTSNILNTITVGGMSSGLDGINRSLKLSVNYKCAGRIEVDRTEYEHSQTFISLHIALNGLNSVFSISWLLQEAAFLLLVILCLVGALKTAKLASVIVQTYLLGMSFQLICILACHFYPMVTRNLRSKIYLQLCKCNARDRESRRLVRMSGVLKIRPMGVHTITTSTVSDYVIFLISGFMMLSKI